MGKRNRARDLGHAYSAETLSRSHELRHVEHEESVAIEIRFEGAATKSKLRNRGAASLGPVSSPVAGSQ